MKPKIFTKRQEAQVNMADVVFEHLDNNAGIVALNLGFQEAFDEAKAIVDDVKSLAPQGAAATSGLTEGKNISKEVLSEKGARIAGFGFAYAAKNGNTEMQAAFDVSKSELLEMKDGELALRCQAIYDLAAAHQTALNDYGVTPARLSDLQHAIQAYTQSAQKPRGAITDRAVVKAEIKVKLAKVMKILKERLDRLIEDYAETHPSFVAAYKERRKIVDPKTPSNNKPANGNGEGGTPA